jgi:hypothetical protein
MRATPVRAEPSHSMVASWKGSPRECVGGTPQFAGEDPGSLGGVLGMGEHDIAVSMDKLKFVEEPIKTSACADDDAGIHDRNSHSAHEHGKYDDSRTQDRCE